MSRRTTPVIRSACAPARRVSRVLPLEGENADEEDDEGERERPGGAGNAERCGVVPRQAALKCGDSGGQLSSPIGVTDLPPVASRARSGLASPTTCRSPRRTSTPSWSAPASGARSLAYRLAEAGRSVCVLERGKPYPPGSFPRGPSQLSKAFWDPSEGLYGMFNVWSFTGLGAVVSSGLGGGSLIYANVLLRKPERWFVQEDLAARRLRELARDAERPRAALRPGRGDAERPALSVRRHDAQDRGPPRRGGEAGAGVHPPEAGGHLRERRGGPRRRRPDPRGASQPPRQAALHLPSRAASATSAATSGRRTRST